MVRVRDRKYEFGILPFSDDVARALLEPVPVAERESVLRLALPDGRLLDDGEALAYILQRLPGLRMIGNVARLPGGRRVMRSLYWTVASNRGRLADFVRYRPLIVRRPEGEGAEGPQKQEGPQQ